VQFDPGNKEEELERFYQRIIKKDARDFKISPEYAAGLYGFAASLGQADLSRIRYIKCHITGPFTFAAGINDASGVALLHDGVFMQAITEGLKMKALWQIDFFRKHKKKIIVFIDEPYLGCFGSAYTPINRDDAVKVLKDLAASIKGEGAVAGVHCCGNTDWSIFVDAGLDILNFDAYCFLDRFVLYADSLREFRGDFCWGIVPTQELGAAEESQALIDKITQGIKALAKKGLAEESLWENLILSPSCGLGTLSESKAEYIFRQLGDVSSLIRKK